MGFQFSVTHLKSVNVINDPARDPGPVTVVDYENSQVDVSGKWVCSVECLVGRFLCSGPSVVEIATHCGNY